MKVTHHENYRIVVEQASYPLSGRRSHEWIMRDYDDMAASIKRHVGNVGYCTVQFDTVHLCSFCGFVWETEPDGFPVCCEAAQREWCNETGKRFTLLVNDEPSLYGDEGAIRAAGSGALDWLNKVRVYDRLEDKEYTYGEFVRIFPETGDV